MASLRDRYEEEYRLYASGAAGGTRSTYIEWLNERQVLLLKDLVALFVPPLPEEVEDAGPEDEDGADPA